ncbi:hypothetical protein WDW86_14605 [Bdellovibrionota bacterium FG-2]
MRTPPKGHIRVWVLFVPSLALLVTETASANEYAPIVELGTTIHSGVTGKSLTGANGYFMAFRSERRKGLFRPEMAAELQRTSGNVTVGSEAADVTVLGAAFLGGFHCFFFKEGRFQPFVGANAVLGWHSLRMTTPPSGIEPYTQGLSYGFEATAGVDMRFGGFDGTAFRLNTGMWSVSSSLAGVSGFQLGGVRIAVGLVF